MKVTTLEEAKLNIVKNPLVLLFFTTTWCGECHMSRKSLDKITDQFPTIKICEIDVDKEELWEENNPKQFSIKSVPTFVFFKEKNEIIRSCGFKRDKDLKILFEQNL